MGLKDDINAQAEADRVKFEKDQATRLKEAELLGQLMSENGVPESKRPI